MADTTTPAKRCTKCGESKPPDDFHRKASSKDGLNSRCKPCAVADSVARQRANPEQARARRARYRDAHQDRIRAHDAERRDAKREGDRRYYAENRDKLLEYQRQYRAENGEDIREYKRRYSLANSEKAIGRAKAWAKANPDRDRLNRNNVRRRRQAKKAGATRNDFTAAQWVAMIGYFGGRCAYCGLPCEDLTQDHMTPISRRGDHSEDNIVPSCRSCNGRKGARTLVELLLAEQSHVSPHSD